MGCKTLGRLALVLFLTLLPLFPTYAQAEDVLWIRLSPLDGPPGTTVTISGGGAPAGAEVHILVAAFWDESTCHLGRGADATIVVQADAAGRFSATHPAARINPQQRGNGYRAARLLNTSPRPQSNVACFSFVDAPATRYFPETGHNLRGRFLEYWATNGGLMVFGFPLTIEHQAINSSGDYTPAQYTERQRFEYHAEHGRPYDVLLGRLGAELLALQGRDPTAIPRAEPISGCRYFVETGHNVCNQEPGRGFLSYWQAHGLDFADAGVSNRESLALFGYPLTEAALETNSSGDTVVTQWFERARFEWHPTNPQPFNVLLGRLGAELLDFRPLPPTFDTVSVYLIALGGGKVGCNDRLIPIERTVEPTAAPLTAAIEELLAVEPRLLEESDLYTGLHSSNLQVESVVLDVNNHATVRLIGDFRMGGVCDAPRIREQLRATALQFNTVSDVTFFINGVSLDEALDQR